MALILRSFPLLLLFLSTSFGEETESLLYPYGSSVGDKTTPVEDDGTSGEVHISAEFIFFSKTYKALYVNNNGVISFKTAVAQYTPDAFPLTNGETFVTPFWGDVDNDLSGMVYYRETTDQEPLAQITSDMKVHVPDAHFAAKWAFIATWDKVAYYGSASDKVNTFQVALTTDGYRSFIILNYGRIQWTTGTASGGDAVTGLGGTPAQAGFNSGDSTHYFNIPGSRTDEVLNIITTSNVNRPGRWVFRVDDFKVPGGCVFEANYAKEGEDFWTDSSCTKKCQCNSSGDVKCSEETCSENDTCEPSGTFFKCQEKEETCY